VRGATLRDTATEADRHAARPAAPPADAEAVRSALEEFEAAVERAHRDSVAPDAPQNSDGAGKEPHDQNHLPEGAEQ
jgi:hypothetical protein